MRILFIHEVNYENKVIYEMHEFPELLALRGHDVAFLHYPEGGGSAHLRSRRKRIGGRAYPDAEIELITPPTFGGAAWERFLAPLLVVPALRREIRRGGYDAVFLYSVPTSGWQAVAIAKRAGVPVMFRALDVSHKIRRTAVSSLIKRAEHAVYRGVDLVSANNPAMLSYCLATAQRDVAGVVHLPPLDFSHFEGGDGPAARARVGVGPDERVILYMGSFFDFSGLDVVLERLADELHSDERLRLVLVGGGDLTSSLTARVSELGLGDRVLFTGVIPYAELPDYIAMADVAINPFRKELVTDVALPHKVFQYAAAGVATVTTDLDGLHGVVGDGHGFTWAAGPAEVADEALRLVREPVEVRQQLAGRQRERMRELASIEVAIAAMEDSLSTLS